MTATPKKKQHVEFGDLLAMADITGAAAKYRRPLSLPEAEAILRKAASHYGILPEAAIAELHGNSTLARLARKIFGISDEALDPKWVAFVMVETIRREGRIKKLDAVYAEASRRIEEERPLGSKAKPLASATVERYHKLVVAHLEKQSVADLFSVRPKQIRRPAAKKRTAPAH